MVRASNIPDIYTHIMNRITVGEGSLPASRWKCENMVCYAADFPAGFGEYGLNKAGVSRYGNNKGPQHTFPQHAYMFPYTVT